MPASTTGADLDLLRPFTAVLRRRGLTDCDPALERRFMGLPGLFVCQRCTQCQTIRTSAMTPTIINKADRSSTLLTLHCVVTCQRSRHENVKHHADDPAVRRGRTRKRQKNK